MKINSQINNYSQNNTRNTPLLLVDLLESFSKKELEGLQNLATYAYFNTDKLVVNLLDALVKHILGKAWTPEATQIRLYNNLFCNSATEIKKLDKKQKARLNAKMSLLTRLAERFLRMEALEKSQSNRCEMLMNSLLERKQHRLFKKHLAKEKKSIENEPKDHLYFKKLYLFEEEEINYLANTGSLKKSNNIKAVMWSLDLWYLSNKINYATLEQNLSKQNTLSAKIQPLQELIETEIFKNSGYEKYPIFILQLTTLELMYNKKHSNYCKLLDLLHQNELKIAKAYLIQFYTAAVNFCVHQTKSGKTEYFQYYVDLHKILDSKQLITNNKIIQIGKFINIVGNGCKAQDFKWVFYMIEKYSICVNKKYRNNIVKYSLGYVAFEQKKFQQALNYFFQVENFQKTVDINTRILILKSYYELEKHYSEPTAQLFRSIESFVKNHKRLTNQDKSGYQTFIRIFYNLYRIKHRVGSIQLAKLKERIDNAEFISNKLWLLEKIAELEGRR